MDSDAFAFALVSSSFVSLPLGRPGTGTAVDRHPPFHDLYLKSSEAQSSQSSHHDRFIRLFATKNKTLSRGKPARVKGVGLLSMHHDHLSQSPYKSDLPAESEPNPNAPPSSRTTSAEPHQCWQIIVSPKSCPARTDAQNQLHTTPSPHKINLHVHAPPHWPPGARRPPRTAGEASICCCCHKPCILVLFLGVIFLVFLLVLPFLLGRSPAGLIHRGLKTRVVGVQVGDLLSSAADNETEAGQRGRAVIEKGRHARESKGKDKKRGEVNHGREGRREIGRVCAVFFAVETHGLVHPPRVV